MKTTVLTVLIAAALQGANCPPPPSQTPSAVWDSRGNSLLNGSYYFRYIQYWTGDQLGDLSRAISLYSTISFTKGAWSISGASMMDSAAAPPSSTAPAPCVFNASGTYSLSAGTGYGFISNPLNPADVIWGAVASNGVFIGTSSENSSGYNDLFIAVPTASGSTSVTSSTLSGIYSIAYLNFPDGYVQDVIAAGFQIEPQGTGSLGTINIQAYQGNSATAVNVPEQASYAFSNGAFKLTFPPYGMALAGQQYLYSTPDGSFVFGGSPAGYDFFVGVQSNTGSAQFSGLFYQAGITETMSASSTPVTGALETWHGAFNSVQGNILNHQRILAPLRLEPNALGYYAAPYSLTQATRIALAFNARGGYTDPSSGMEYVIGTNGAIRVGFGTPPILGISVGLAAPASATTPPLAVGITPAGIVNAASSSPFTAGISAGEAISIYGFGFTPGTVPVTFASNTAANTSASMTVSGTAVSSSQIDVAVPTSLTGPWGTIQVGSSPVVWEPLYQTTLGVFSQSETGLADADASNAAGLITPLNPAIPGSTVNVSLTGVGAIAEGFQGQLFPATGLAAMIGSTSATATFPATLSSTGVVTASVTIPAGLTPGENTLTISGPDSQTMQTTIFIGGTASGTSAAVNPAPGHIK